MNGIKGFGYSFSSNVKDMNEDQTPDFAIGAVSGEGEHVALFLKSRPTVAIKPISTALPSGVIETNKQGNNPYTVD